MPIPAELQNKNFLIKMLTSFEGRISRRMYWLYWFLPLFVVLFILTLLGDVGVLIMGVIALVLFWPNICINSKRLHDIGYSGWWQLLHLIPLGGIVLLVFFCLPTQQGANKYGEKPIL